MTFRAFISVDLGRFPRVDAFSEALRAAQGQLTLVDLELLHTTLKFLGETDEALMPEIVALVEKSVAGTPPTTVTLRGTGAFPEGKRIRVVWVGLEGAGPFASIAATLDREMEALGFPPEGRRWQPHVTVARVKGGRNLERVRAAIAAHADEEFGDVRVDGIRLKRSVLTPRGPEYTTVAEVPLTG